MFLFVSMVRVEVPEFTTDAGLKVSLERDKLVTDRLTVPVKPGVPVIVTVYVATPFLLTVALAGWAEI